MAEHEGRMRRQRRKVVNAVAAKPRAGTRAGFQIPDILISFRVFFFSYIQSVHAYRRHVGDPVRDAGAVTDKRAPAIISAYIVD